MSSIPNISNLPNIDNISTETADKLTQNILIELTPYLYGIIGIVSLICLLLIYISIMTTLTFKRTGNRPQHQHRHR
jgi:hypothetical protein